MRSVLDKIAESLEGEVTIEPDWLSEHVGVLPEDRVRIDPAVWAQVAGFIERREAIRADYQTFTGRVSVYHAALSPPRLPRELVCLGLERAKYPRRHPVMAYALLNPLTVMVRSKICFEKTAHHGTDTAAGTEPTGRRGAGRAHG